MGGIGNVPGPIFAIWSQLSCLGRFKESKTHRFSVDDILAGLVNFELDTVSGKNATFFSRCVDDKKGEDCSALEE